MNETEILSKLQEKTITGLDLTQFDFTKNKVSFAGKQLEGLDFSDNKTLKNVSFQKAVLIDCKFERAAIDACDFTMAEIKGTGAAKYASFKDAKLYKTKFRDASIEVCDFRYADIEDCTLQGAYLKFTDFYRTAFKGITVFQDCKIESSSLNYISFETFCFTSENLKKNKSGGVLVQENEDVYEEFLGKWIRLDNVKNEMSIIEGGLSTKYAEAERIYRQLSALWEERGHNRDGDWAYIQAKRMERKRLWFETKTKKIRSKLSAISNLLIDIFLGYGVSLAKVFGTYLIVLVIFAFIYRALSGDDIGRCIILSFSYSIGERGDDVVDAIDNLSMFQTGLGILLTGFMGFIAANKVRKS